MQKIWDIIKGMSKKQLIWSGIGVFVVICLLFSLCGGGDESVQPEPKKDVILTVDQTEVKGELKGCFEVVDRNYKVKFAEYGIGDDHLMVELKRTDAELPYDRNSVVNFYDAEDHDTKHCAGFGIEILDADKNVIAKKTAKEVKYGQGESINEVLRLLSGDTGSIEFDIRDLDKAASFRITSTLEPNTAYAERQEELKKEAAEEAAEAAREAAEEAKAAKSSKSSDDDEDGGLFGAVKDAYKTVIEDIEEDEDLQKAKKSTEAALKVAGEGMKLAGKMLDLL